MVDVCLLGCGGSLPVPNRSLTSCLISYKGSKILIDCGEGTQLSMKILGWGFKNIDVICFTHYHADHIIGLPGLLLTIANSGRENPIVIIGPEGLKKVIKGLTVVCPYLPYYIDLIELPTTNLDYFEDKILSLENMEIKALPVDHTVPCLSYSISIKRNRRFNADMAKKNNVPLKLWNLLQKGNYIKENNILFTPDMVLDENRTGIKLSYCTDSRPTEQLINFIQNSDLFICEGMYGDDEKLPKALENKHMTFSEAAIIAKKANVSELWLTHFSPSLLNPSEYLEHTKSIFKNSHLGEDRKISNLKFK